MSRDDLTAPVAAAATAQVKLCLYDEEEPHIWFRLIEAQFAAAGIKSQKPKYANALASLPKQVLRDIWDTLDVCNDSAKPVDFLKHTLLRQFLKSKWQSWHAGFFTFFFSCATTKRSRNHFLPSEEVFAHPGPEAPSQPPQTGYLSRQRARPKRLDL
jgi:hypothetical protein